ncbi:MAG: hypothetical protein F4X62_22585 [Caldilineaceae bacterium SB0662_bin_25]|nr:hypothetical protein [Caldilineaceae bacterium SB0662_bin_25]
MKKTRIRTLFLGRPKGDSFPGEENEEWPIYQGSFSHENLAARYREELKAYGREVEFTGQTLVRTRGELVDTAAKVQDEDGVLVFILGLFPNVMQKEIASWGKPTVMFNPTEAPLSPLAWLHNFVPVKGKSNVIPVLSSDFADVGKKIGVLKAIHKMRQSKVLYQQSHTPKQVESSRRWFEEGWGGIHLFSDLTPLSDGFIKQAKERLGLEIKDIPPQRLIAAYQNADARAAEALAQSRITGATDVVEPTREDVVESCKLYLGIKQILAEEGAQGITEHGICMGSGPYPLPCLAFSMLNDEGLAGICQLDLSSTITQLLIGYLADRPGFIGHIHIDTGRNLIGMSHDFSATRLGGWESEEAEEYAFRNHQGLYRSTCVNVQMEVGQTVTIAQYVPFDRMYVFTGVIDSNVSPQRDCRTSVAIRVADVKRLLRNCMKAEHPLTPGGHRLLFYGDWVDEIEDLGQLLGFEVVNDMEQ